MNINNNNMNLLPIFLIILEELSLSRAAQRLGMSQPALSHSLARMREEFDDQLFVRAPGGLVPTSKALELKPKLVEFSDLVNSIYEQNKQVSPLEFKGRIVLSTTAYFEQVIIKKFVESLRNEAPKLELITHNLSTESELVPRQQLEKGEVDLVVAGFFKDLPDSVFRTVLFEDPFCVVARKNHPYFGTQQSARDLCDYPHLMISLRGDLRGRMDEELKKKKLERKIHAGLGNFFTPALLLPDSDYLLVCPLRLAQSYARFLPVEHHEVPLELRPVKMQMIWHERLNKDPVQKWVRNKIKLLSSARE